MPLEESCIAYLNQVVLVWPIHGHGWSRSAAGSTPYDPAEQIEVPAPFRVRLVDFVRFEGEIAGAIGVVEELLHPLDEEWAGFFIRDREVDTYNFTTTAGKYNIEIGKDRPIARKDPEESMGCWSKFENCSSVGGFAWIAVTVEYLRGLPGCPK